LSYQLPSLYSEKKQRSSKQKITSFYIEMKVAVFSAKPYNQLFLNQINLHQRLLTFPIVIMGHQAFFSEDALTNIVTTTLDNISAIAKGQSCSNQVILPT